MPLFLTINNFFNHTQRRLHVGLVFGGRECQSNNLWNCDEVWVAELLL